MNNQTKIAFYLMIALFRGRGEIRGAKEIDDGRFVRVDFWPPFQDASALVLPCHLYCKARVEADRPDPDIAEQARRVEFF